jgi:hypothetical protein
MLVTKRRETGSAAVSPALRSVSTIPVQFVRMNRPPFAGQPMLADREPFFCVRGDVMKPS